MHRWDVIRLCEPILIWLNPSQRKCLRCICCTSKKSNLFFYMLSFFRSLPSHAPLNILWIWWFTIQFCLWCGCLQIMLSWRWSWNGMVELEVQLSMTMEQEWKYSVGIELEYGPEIRTERLSWSWKWVSTKINTIFIVSFVFPFRQIHNGNWIV